MEKKKRQTKRSLLGLYQAFRQDCSWVFLQMADFQGDCQLAGLAGDTEVSQLVLKEL